MLFFVKSGKERDREKKNINNLGAGALVRLNLIYIRSGSAFKIHRDEERLIIFFFQLIFERKLVTILCVYREYELFFSKEREREREK